jgi:hypothetical protein
MNLLSFICSSLIFGYPKGGVTQRGVVHGTPHARFHTAHLLESGVQPNIRRANVESPIKERNSSFDIVAIVVHIDGTPSIPLILCI